MQHLPIAGDGNAERFALRLEPDGVYRIDGRTIPATDHPAARVDNAESVIRVHGGRNERKGLIGATLGVHVEERELELVPSTE